MQKELPYFSIEGAFGGSQAWFINDNWMKIGGCAAVTACDCSIYFSLYKNRPLAYPGARKEMTRREYIALGMKMKPYLRPRFMGIDRLEIYEEGFSHYLEDQGVRDIVITGFDGSRPYEDALAVVKKQIDAGWPVPVLTLKHREPSFANLVWHWYLLTGYDNFEDVCAVKVTTYGTWRWLDLKELWHTGHRRKGGLILFTEKDF
ncbi:MAG: hypothetical protein LKE33_06155 [Acidaminococcus sp.]|jgi:hypothetical protein|nr:hypothetical protein [Acidaminococcus sp.]MCI2099905.1 hypothetical protein [Acidaminococcus sp.]MCI2114136.1 hypothetical protein [Acidaminococcus sp.]MCI2116076.1 hypothetical protein [Acidaminococcus sp.]